MALRLRAAGSRVTSEFVVVGHVTRDRFPEGGEQAGGSAFYAAALAERCGLGVTLVTAGEPDAVAAGLGELAERIDVLVQPESETTTLLTWFEDGQRCQRAMARAPAIAPVLIRCEVLHLAPVLQELAPDWSRGSRAGLVGLTPQGLVRRLGSDGTITLEARPGLERYRADVIVLSEHEVGFCQALVDAVRTRGGTVVITRAGRAAEVVRGDLSWEVAAIPTEVREELGAGDVFAAALFIAMHEGKATEAAVRFAHAAASLRLRDLGMAAIPERAQIDALLKATARTQG